MPITTLIGLTNSKGLKKILQFDGLGLRITILPSVETLGEPLLTKQAFYFLGDIEAVGKTRLKTDSILYECLDEEFQRDAIIEYILDNYLFNYSISNDESKLTSKVKRYRFLSTEYRDRYVLGDKANTKYLAVDTLNDRSILLCKDTVDPEMSFESDWRLFNNYFMSIHSKYVAEIESILDRKITLKTKSDSVIEEETLPVVKFLSKPYKHEELEQMSHIGYVDKSDRHLKGGFYEYSSSSSANSKIPMEHMFAKDFHNKYLLDVYFAGLREHSPTVQFKHFYNVLEYLFEDVTVFECKKHLPEEVAESITDLSDWKNWKNKLSHNFPYAKNKIMAEETQLKIVVNLFIDKVEFTKKIRDFDRNIRDHFLKPILINKKITIHPLDLNDNNILDKYSERIYFTRNSIMHTKRTRYGKAAFTILPFSESELFLQREIPLLQFVAQKVIQKEKDIFEFTTLSFSPLEILILMELLYENHNYETLIENLSLFLSNSQSKLDETRYEEFLDHILGVLVEIIDQARLDGPIPLEKIRDELSKIDVGSFDETTQLVINCLILLLHGDMDRFNKLVKKLPIFTMRAKLYGLQNSLK